MCMCDLHSHFVWRLPPCSFLVLYCHLGYIECYSPATLLACVGTICLAAATVESLPLDHVLDDNLSVPVVAALLSALLLAPSL